MRCARAIQAAATVALLALGSRPAVARPVAASATRDSAALRLPFEPIQDPSQSFAASKLNRTYEKDLTRLLRQGERRPRLDLEMLDRYASEPNPAVVPAEDDSTDIRLVGSRPEGTGTELTPEDKREATPPQAGVQVGIPSTVSTPAVILGGIAVFIKVLSEFLK